MTTARLWRLALSAIAVSTLAIGASSPAQQRANVAPERPNIIVVLMDDVGFASDSTFGGPVPTPVLDGLAAGGLIYNRFHVTAMCSPTRAALLTGRNHHRVEMGVIVNLARDEPGFRTVIPDSAATIADVLSANGYTTAMLGKNHITPKHEQTAAGPFDRWPTGLGFDYFYGFMDGASDQINPILIENRIAIDPVPVPAEDPDYILDRDLADRAISWIAQVRGAAPERPFFLYLAPGTGHEPHQAPAEWRERFRGQFDMGWDVLREQIFARQIKSGLIPAGTRMADRPDVIPAWDALSPDDQRVAARLMETYAAMRAHFDHQFGRIVETLRARGELDNTLILFIDGDNGASGEGGPLGTTLGLLNRPQEDSAYRVAAIDEIGTGSRGSNYNVGWGWALNAPFPWFKQHASYLGGTRAGLVVSWPATLGAADNRLRSQYGHITDIAPTIYEAAGVTAPDHFAGVPQLPIDGTSLLYSFKAASAPSRRQTQYYEMLGNFGIYHDGWLANISPPNVMFAPQFGREKRWELYNLEEDFAQAENVAAQYPQRLAQLQELWKEQQEANGFSLNRNVHAGEALSSPPAEAFATPRRLTYRREAGPIIDGAFPFLSGRKWRLSVPIDVSEQSEGTLISQGGEPFGWGLYIIDGRPSFVYVNEPHPVTMLQGSRLMPGAHLISVGYEPDGDFRPGGPARISLSVDGEVAATTHLERTVSMFWGANGVGIGREVGTIMLPELGKPFVFTGAMGAVTLDLE